MKEFIDCQRNGEIMVAIVLGGTFPHAELLKKLKARGYYTILVDYFENPPAAYAADEHIRESAMDYDIVLNIAKERQASLVICSCLDQQMIIAMQVAEKLNLPHPFSSEIAMNVTNKKYMKKIMMENNIPTARYYQVSELSDLESINIDYPAIVKPTDSCGAAGVRKVESKNELVAAVKNACYWSRTGEAIVEEFKDGIEISAYTYINNGVARLVTTTQRISVLEEDVVKCFCGLSPAKIPEEIEQKVETIATRIAQAFQLKNTPLFFQAIVKNGEVSVIEFSPRLGGGMCYRIMQKNTNFDMIDASIDSYLGNNVFDIPEKEKARFVVQQVHGKNGVFDHMEGVEQLLSDDTIDEIYFYKTKGMKISSEKSSSARTAVLLIEDEDEDMLIQKVNRAMNCLEIRDPEGKALMDRSLVLNKEVLKLNEYN